MTIGERNIRVEKSEFKGKEYISIRQWYDAGGEMRPGNKGINLTPEEWEEMITRKEEIFTE